MNGLRVVDTRGLAVRCRDYLPCGWGGRRSTVAGHLLIRAPVEVVQKSFKSFDACAVQANDFEQFRAATLGMRRHFR
jgi:hypothetical protein